MLLTRTSRSGQEPPHQVIGTSTVQEGVASVLPSGIVEGDSCPWPRTEKKPSDRRSRRVDEPRDIVEEWGWGSFPASDPPANW